MPSTNITERLGLRGKLKELSWVEVSRGGKAPAGGDGVVHNVRSSEDIADAFGRRERTPPSS
jgi:hypothetical protein